MTYQYTDATQDMVVDLDTGTFIPRGNYLWPEDESLIQLPPPPTFAEYYSTFLSAFSQWMESVAAQNQYDSMLSCASYVTSSVEQYSNDAKAIIAWRDALWTWAAAWQAGFNGQLPATIPTWEEIQQQAPQPAAYGWVVHDPGSLAGASIGAMPLQG